MQCRKCDSPSTVQKMKRLQQLVLSYRLQIVNEEGQGLIEYVMLVLLIAVSLIAMLTSLGVTLPTILQLISEQLQSDRR